MKVLFKVISGEHEYLIYTDGTIEGFPEDSVVVNYYSQIQRELSVRSHDLQAAQSRTSEASRTACLPSGQ